jgi:hypothetical protein
MTDIRDRLAQLQQRCKGEGTSKPDRRGHWSEHAVVVFGGHVHTLQVRGKQSSAQARQQY